MSSPSQLLSLWDMLKVYAKEYVEIGGELSELEMVLHMAESSNGEDRKLRPDELRQMERALGSLAEKCSAIGLDVTEGLAKLMLSKHPQTSREVEMLRDALYIELQRTLFFHVPQDRALLFDARPADVIVDEFPSAARELVRAGNCYAFGEYTASVFHSMRTMEIALKALYKCLALAPMASRNWGDILKEIRGEILKRGAKLQGADQFQDLAATLSAVKDGWRNPSLHVDASHSEAEAERIYKAVLHFMEKVSGLMDEKGLPLA